MAGQPRTSRRSSTYDHSPLPTLAHSFQMRAVAKSTFLKRLAAVVRSRTAANGDSTTFVVRRWRQCSRGNWYTLRGLR